MTGNQLKDGTELLLQADTEILFQISEGTQAKIIGPAKLAFYAVNTDDGVQYIVSMRDGTYMEMQSTEEKIDNVVVETPHMQIAAQQEQVLHFTVTNTQENTVVVNKGEELLVAKGEQSVLLIEDQEASLNITPTVVQNALLEVSTPAEVEELLEEQGVEVIYTFDDGFDDIIDTTSQTDTTTQPTVVTTREILTVEQE